MTNYDFVVIGSGPAGRRAAIQAAKLSRSVLVVERGRRVGGVSVHTGTIPSKTLRETVLNLTGWRERGFYGRAYRVKKDIEAKDLMMRLHMTLDHEVDVLEHQFARNSVHTLRGTARFLDPHRMEVVLDNGDVRAIEGERFLIAVGTRPHRPADVPFNGHNVLDSDEIVDVPRLPRSLTVVGAGVIGVEYATIFSALDVSVALVEARPGLLEFIDDELIEDFTHQLRDRGMALRFGCKVSAHRIRERLAGHRAGERPPAAVGDAALRRRPRRRDRRAEPGFLRAGAGSARAAEGQPGDVPDRGAAYLLRRRRHRFP